jgi:hypothetical protein
MVARIEARYDHAVAIFIEKCGGETLIAAGAGAFEGIETDGVHRLDASLESVLDAEKIFFQFGAEDFQFVDRAIDVDDGSVKTDGIRAREETVEFAMKIYDETDHDEDDYSGNRESDDNDS